MLVVVASSKAPLLRSTLAHYTTLMALPDLCTFLRLYMEPLLEIDLSSAIPFAYARAFQHVATIQDENRVRAYVPNSFITRMKRRVTCMSLDLLMSALLRTVVALPNTEEAELELGLLSASVIALSGHGSSEEKTENAHRPLLCITCEQFSRVQLETIHHSAAYSKRTLSPCSISPSLYLQEQLLRTQPNSLERSADTLLK